MRSAGSSSTGSSFGPQRFVMLSQPPSAAATRANASTRATRRARLSVSRSDPGDGREPQRIDAPPLPSPPDSRARTADDAITPDGTNEIGRQSARNVAAPETDYRLFLIRIRPAHRPAPPTRAQS